MTWHNGSLVTGSQLTRLIRDSTQGVRDRVAGLTAAASGTLGQIEALFTQRVSRALHALQIPTARDVQELSLRVEALQQAVERLERKRGERIVPPARVRRRRPAA
jgi:poly(hydroxyalkanoate) granule-associated protein